MKIKYLLVCALLLGSARLALCNDNAAGTSPAISAAKVNAAIASPMHPMKTPGVPNFGKLSDNIWRSGQPTRAGYQFLASQGLKTVVNLRSEYPQDQDLVPAGVKYIYIPIKDTYAPTTEQAQEFIRAASDPANWPLLVHCHAGEGRAGVMSALARWSLDKWQDKAIMTEVGNFRSSHGGLYKFSMPQCQKQFIQQWENTANSLQVASQFTPPTSTTALPSAPSQTKATTAAQSNSSAAPAAH